MAIEPKFLDAPNKGETAPAQAVRAIVKGTNSLPQGPCRAIWCGTAGSANIVDADGNLCQLFPLIKGMNPIRAKAILAGGDALNLWAMY